MLLCKNKFFILVAVLLLLASCGITKSLWNGNYNETFRQFLVSQDGKYVVFLGKNYHYIFTDNSSVIRELLLWSNRNCLFINVEKTFLRLDLKNNVTGHVVIESFFNRLPHDDYEFLRSLGFRSEGGKALSMKINLAGKRYLPRDDLGQYLPELDRTYIVPIHYSSTFWSNVGKVALTPITVAADATILIGKIILHPFRAN